MTTIRWLLLVCTATHGAAHAQFAAFIRADGARRGKVIREAGILAE